MSGKRKSRKGRNMGNIVVVGLSGCWPRLKTASKVMVTAVYGDNYTLPSTAIKNGSERGCYNLLCMREKVDGLSVPSVIIML